MELKKVIDKYHSKMTEVIKSARFTIDESPVSIDKWVGEVLDIFEYIRKNRNSLFFIGNGASCSIASHFAADFTKNGGIRSYSCNEVALLTCFSNDFSYETAYKEIIKRYMDEGDALIAISSSGNSRNILNAADFVSDYFNDDPVITLSGFSEDNPLRKKGRCNLFLDVKDYGFVESGHAYYMHLLIDLFIKRRQDRRKVNE